MQSPFPKVLTQPRQKGSDGDGVGWFGHVYFVLHIVALRLILLCMLYMMLFLFLYVFDVRFNNCLCINRVPMMIGRLLKGVLRI